MVLQQQCFTEDIFNFHYLILNVVDHCGHLKIKAQSLSFKQRSREHGHGSDTIIK